MQSPHGLVACERLRESLHAQRPDVILPQVHLRQRPVSSKSRSQLSRSPRTNLTGQFEPTPVGGQLRHEARSHWRIRRGYRLIHSLEFFTTAELPDDGIPVSPYALPLHAREPERVVYRLPACPHASANTGGNPLQAVLAIVLWTDGSRWTTKSSIQEVTELPIRTPSKVWVDDAKSEPRVVS